MAIVVLSSVEEDSISIDSSEFRSIKDVSSLGVEKASVTLISFMDGDSFSEMGWIEEYSMLVLRTDVEKTPSVFKSSTVLFSSVG